MIIIIPHSYTYVYSFLRFYNIVSYLLSYQLCEVFRADTNFFILQRSKLRLREGQ